MVSAGLALRALRWRAASSVTIFLVAVLAVLSAMIGPIYLATARQAVFTDRLGELPIGVRDITVDTQTIPSTAGSAHWRRPVLATAGAAARSSVFGPPQLVTRLSVQLPQPVRRSILTLTLTAVDGVCAHLRLVAGHCPTDAPEVVISQRAARAYHVHVGSTLAGITSVEDGPAPVVVAGVYVPIRPRGPFFAPWGFFGQRVGQLDTTENATTNLDAAFTTRSTLDVWIGKYAEDVTAHVPLRVGSTRVGHEDDVRAAVNAARLVARQESTGAHPFAINAATGLLGALPSIDSEVSVTDTIVDLATVQLTLIAICILYSLVSASAGLHAGEVALAKLRGRRRRDVLARGLIEPLALIAVAAPVGALLAWLVDRVVAGRYLGGAHVGITAQALGLGAVATGVAVLAAVVASVRMLATPIAALLRDGEERSARSAIGLVVLDVVAVVLCVAGLVRLKVSGVLTAGRPDALAALAPTLAAAAVAIVTVRLLPYALRLVVRATRRSRRVVGFLVPRLLARQPGGIRLAALTAIAAALATVALTTWSVSRGNREQRALNAVGAHTVLTVTPRIAGTFEQAVRRADISGRYAMAVLQPPRVGVPLIAVDASRFAHVAAWQGDQSTTQVRQVAALLHPTTVAAPLDLPGGRMTLALTARLTQPTVPVYAAMEFQLPDLSTQNDVLGRVRVGTHSLRASLPSACRPNCRLISFSVSAHYPPVLPTVKRVQVHPVVDLSLRSATVTSRGGTRPLDLHLEDPSRWHTDDVGSMTITRHGSVTRMVVAPEVNYQHSTPPQTANDLAQPRWPTLLRSDAPTTLPALVASDTVREYRQFGADLSAAGADGYSEDLDQVATTVTLPRLDREGALVDLALAQRTQTYLTDATTRFQVWLAGDAPASIRNALATQGIRVDSTRTPSSVLAVLDRGGPALADELLLVAAVIAAALAAGAMVLSATVIARRRAYEFAALRAVGATAWTVRRAVAAEHGVRMGVGLGIGLVLGTVGAALVLPSTPIFVDTSVGPPVELGLPVATLAWLCAGAAVALATICIAAALVGGRRRWGALREVAR